MNIFSTLKNDILHIISALQAEGKLPAGLALEGIEATPPREASHGDAATNAAMVLAGKAGMKPREIADLLVPKLSALADVERVEIAGPGFINLHLKNTVWQGLVQEILTVGTKFGDSTAGRGAKVNVEYVSANPTGPMHIGHARGAVYGDALASVLQKAGYEVTREYYINDAGGQIDKLAESAFLRYREALGEAIGEIPEGLYPGDYLLPVGAALAKEYGAALAEKPRAEWLPLVRKFAVREMMELVKSDLALLGIRHDVFASEDALTKAGRVEEALRLLESKGLIYEGVLEPPKGKAPEDWEPRPQTLFKATEFGDDQDRAIKKSDGSWTYFAPDIAYHWDKCQRGFTRIIDVFGADHGGYVKRIKAVVQAMTGGAVHTDIKLCQLVKFLRGGQPAKMSKRAGTFVTVHDVVEEVGKDVLRFIMLTRKNDAPLDFDLEKVMEQSRDNPVFYVQYAHARCHSVLRMARDEMPAALEVPTQGLEAELTHPEEIALIKHLANWPRVVEGAADAAEPHRIAFYLQELAAALHGFWNKGNDEIALRFIQKDAIKQTAARLLLVRAVANVIASGLITLGVTPREEMR